MKWLDAHKYVAESPGFDPPSLFAKVICEALPIEQGRAQLLDIGCGTGVVGIYCLVEKKARFVTFNDIRPEAIVAAHANVARQIEIGKVQASQVAYLEGTFAQIPQNVIASHDVVVFNPPQLPIYLTDQAYLEEIGASDVMKAFRLGGPDGLDIVRQFFRWYAGLAFPKPRAIILLSSFLGRREIDEAMHSCGIRAKTLDETAIHLRPCLTDAAMKFAADQNELANRSLEQKNGQWTKRLLTLLLQNA